MNVATPRRVLLALAIAAAIAVIGVARFGGGPSSPSTSGAQQGGSSFTVPGTADETTPAAPTAATTTAAGDAGDDDGLSEDPPVVVQPTEKPDVQESATAFAAAWLNTYPRVTAAQWRARLADKVTGELAADLDDADPASVPAGAKVGNPVQVTVEGSLNTATVPVVTAGEPKPKPLGTLSLTLVNNSGTWLVSQIDWEARQ